MTSPISLAAALRTALLSAVVGVALAASATDGFAYTAEQRAACTPDAFRLCSNEIPSIEGVTACMRKKQSQLSPSCRVVFGK